MCKQWFNIAEAGQQAEFLDHKEGCIKPPIDRIRRKEAKKMQQELTTGQKAQEQKWQKVEPRVWKYENEGDQIEGILQEKRENIGMKNSKAYYIQVRGEREPVMVWGSAILDDRLVLVDVGSEVRITYKGKKGNKKGGQTKHFDVEVAIPIL